VCHALLGQPRRERQQLPRRGPERPDLLPHRMPVTAHTGDQRVLAQVEPCTPRIEHFHDRAILSALARNPLERSLRRVLPVARRTALHRNNWIASREVRETQRRHCDNRWCSRGSGSNSNTGSQHQGGADLYANAPQVSSFRPPVVSSAGGRLKPPMCRALKERLRFASDAVCFAPLRGADISQGRTKFASFVTMLALGDVWRPSTA
jgi:hypothetical protein